MGKQQSHEFSCTTQEAATLGGRHKKTKSLGEPKNQTESEIRERNTKGWRKIKSPPIEAVPTALHRKERTGPKERPEMRNGSPDPTRYEDQGRKHRVH